MNKSLLILSCLVTLIAIGTSSFKAPESLTHASGYSVSTYYSKGCKSCHGGTGTGSVKLSGLPDTVVAGHRYAVSMDITDATEKRWGFDMQAASGTFTTSNANVGLGKSASTTSSTNVHHGSSAPVATPAASPAPSYSFDSIFWTAPAAVPTGGTVKFTFAAVAANDNGNDDGGDNSYQGTFTTVVIVATPVKLESFNASALPNGRVSISWATATESNSDYFEIERSLDGKNFLTEGKVNASGNSNTTKNYSYLDNVATLSGSVYYRLKEVDKSGQFTYSDAKLVVLNASKSQINKVYPNPLKAGQDIKISYTSTKAEKITFQLMDASGKRVSTNNLSVTEGANNLTLPSIHLPAGVYHLAAINADGLIQRVSVVIE